MLRLPLRPRTLRRAVALAVAAAVLVVAALAIFAPKAHAAPDDLTYVYTFMWADAVCMTLDVYPTGAGVAGVIEGIHDDGLTYYQAGQVIDLSVANICPRHTDLVSANATPGRLA